MLMLGPLNVVIPRIVSSPYFDKDFMLSVVVVISPAIIAFTIAIVACDLHQKVYCRTCQALKNTLNPCSKKNIYFMFMIKIL